MSSDRLNPFKLLMRMSHKYLAIILQPIFLTASTDHTQTSSFVTW